MIAGRKQKCSDLFDMNRSKGESERGESESPKPLDCVGVREREIQRALTISMLVRDNCCCVRE